MDVSYYDIILCIFLVVFLLPYVLVFVDAMFNTAYSCKWFGWHDGNCGEKYNDGCSNHAECSKCGKYVMQDSQGNWF